MEFIFSFMIYYEVEGGVRLCRRVALSPPVTDAARTPHPLSHSLLVRSARELGKRNETSISRPCGLGLRLN